MLAQVKLSIVEGATLERNSTCCPDLAANLLTSTLVLYFCLSLIDVFLLVVARCSPERTSVPLPSLGSLLQTNAIDSSRDIQISRHID